MYSFTWINTMFNQMHAPYFFPHTNCISLGGCVRRVEYHFYFYVFVLTSDRMYYLIWGEKITKSKCGEQSISCEA